MPRFPLITRDGASLRLRLLAMMALPLVGIIAGSAVQIAQRADSARASGAAETHIRAAAALDAARSAFGQELLPEFVAVVARNPAVLRSPDALAAVAASSSILARLQTTQAATVKAMTALADVPAVRASQPRFVAELAAARAEISSGSAGALPSQLKLLGDLAASENAQIRAATNSGLDGAATQAVNDVDLVARSTQAASQEIVLFAAEKFALPAQATSSRAAWINVWSTYSDAATQLAQRGAPALVARWGAIDRTPAASRVNTTLAADIVTPSTPSVLQIAELALDDQPRNTGYASVLTQAVTEALRTAHAQRSGELLALHWLIGSLSALMLITVVILLLVRRSVARPLERLAEQALRISEGELIDVQVGGPREVRTVAAALAGSVATLRKVEAQAVLVAAGDLDNPVVRSALPGPLGEAVHSSVTRVVTAIRERERAQTELAHRAAHDALTELPNRAQALVLIEQALHRAQRSGSKTALMFVDLDYFKAVNDSFGHAVGDEVLQRVARRMQEVVRDGDTVARLGGDEFVVLLEDIHDEAHVVQLAERVVSAISTELMVDARAVRIGASVGVAFCRDGDVDADRLLQDADAAAYRAKNAGRGRVEMFDDELRSQLLQRAELEAAIASALEQDEFELYYQPVVDLQDGRTTGVEALIRWNRPGHGLVPPDQFIPVAEQSTLINDVGRWVLRTATAQLALWQRAGRHSSLRMSVNISGRHLASNELVTDVRLALRSSGIDPRLLTLELTETVLIDDPMSTRNLHAVRELGVQIAIDDFGTGFTSIGQLPRLPVDSLKIDRSFVISPDPAHQELVRLIVAAAHAFDLSVVAEGIEHEYQAESLRGVRVESGQGYLFARPRPAGEVFDDTEFESDFAENVRQSDVA